MDFELLGPVRVRQGTDVLPLGGALRQGLLALLLARPNEPVSADALIDALWGAEPDPRRAHRLHLHISKLRSGLGAPDRIVFAASSYTLRVLPDELDAQRFTTMVDDGLAALDDDPRRCAQTLRTALGMWRGEPYQGLDLAELNGSRQQLIERRLVAYETALAAELSNPELAAGVRGQIVGELQDLVDQYPFRERLHVLLMTALYRDGRQADALAAYRSARQTLVDELGLEPGQELRELERRILAGESIESGDPASGPQLSAGWTPVPAQLPPATRGFVGRTTELTGLDELADAHCCDSAMPILALAVLTGTAGVGKTALALQWAHQARERFRDGQLYVDLRGYGADAPVSTDEALAGFLRALGLDGASIPTERADRTAVFRSLADGRRMLIVLDNARAADQVRPLLPGSSSCFVLITSRDALTGLVAREGAHRIDLGRLTDEEARILVHEVLGDQADAEPDAVAVLIKHCARLPLALRIAAEQIAERDGSRVADVVAELADEANRLDMLDAGGDAQTAVRSVFSWSYRQLPPDAARLFRLCGLHPGHTFDAYALTALIGHDGLRTTRRHLATLVGAHLVDDAGTGRYQQHDLLRVYAAELAEQTDRADDRQAALSRLCDYYVRASAAAMDIAYPDDRDRRPRRPASDDEPAMPPLATPELAVRWLDTELANLLAIAKRGDDSGSATGSATSGLELSSILRRYLFTRGHRAEAETLHHLALPIACATDDRVGELTALLGLGDANRFQGRYEPAFDQYQQALAIAQAVGDQPGELDTLLGLGHVYRLLGRNGQALELLQRALKVAETISDRAGELAAHRALSRVHRLLGQGELAFGLSRRAVRIAQTCGNRAGELHALNDIGDAYRYRGQYPPARNYYEQALGIARAVGDRAGEKDALLGLGHVHRVLCRYERAIDLYTQALGIARATGDRLGELCALNSIGHVDRLRGEHGPAADSYQRVLDRARGIGSHNWQFEALQGLGRLHQTNADPEQAVVRHRQALELATYLEQPDDQARAHDGLAHAYAALGQREQAGRHWQRALDILSASGTEYTEDEEATADAIHAHLAAL